jgi:hypothetical protein
MAPLALTNSQMDTVTAHARHIPRGLRDSYLLAIADQLRDQAGSVGDGDLHRAVVEASRQVMELGRRQPRERAATESLPLRASAPT